MSPAARMLPLGPLLGPADTSIWEYPGFYLATHLRLAPLPQLELVSDQALYPYGVSSAFLPWALERDGFFALGSTHLGPGPWLVLYVALSLLVTFVGARLLVGAELGRARGWAAAAAVTAFAFPSLGAFPDHLNLCALHWVTLGVLVDFLVVRRVVLEQPFPLRLLMLRVTLVALTLGLDLGYVAGLGLTSFVLSMPFAAAMGLGRGRGRASTSEVRGHPVVVTVLAAVTLGAVVFYVPLVAQIAAAARAPELRGLPTGTSAVAPWHLMLPYVPALGRASGLPGWTLLGLGVLGLSGAGRRWTMHVPALALLAACASYDPGGTSALGVLPWFQFARHADRLAVVYPALFTTFALSIDPARWGRARRRATVGTFAIIGATELVAFASRHLPVRLDDPTPAFFAYARGVRETPGAALLDWPFCVASGNGVGAGEGLCPYYTKGHDDLALAPYHRKKLVGGYFGRLHPSQLRPLLRAHWPSLFAPDDGDVFRASRQTRCFDDDEWAFFTAFLARGDFAGVQLHVSLLPEACVDEFRRRFGAPSATLSLADGDDLAFFPKPAELRALLDPDVDRGLTFQRELRPVDLPVDALASPTPRTVDLDGASNLERRGASTWRWATGPRTTLSLSLAEGRTVRVHYRYANPPEVAQRVRVFVDEQPQPIQEVATPDATVEGSVAVPGTPGAHAVRFECSTWNGKDGVWFARGDARPMSVRLTLLRVE